jgi:hypothetical protein
MTDHDTATAKRKKALRDSALALCSTQNDRRRSRALRDSALALRSTQNDIDEKKPYTY